MSDTKGRDRPELSGTRRDKAGRINEAALTRAAAFLRSYFSKGLDWELSEEEARFIAREIYSQFSVVVPFHAGRAGIKRDEAGSANSTSSSRVQT